MYLCLKILKIYTMIKKVILVIYDGLGDRPVPELNNLTPLEAAYTPNMDKYAKQAECGLMYTLGRGIVPGSDTAHLAILGCDPHKYYNGRGPIEAFGIGLKLEDGDIAFRGNMGSVDEHLNIIDRRAGRIRNVKPFTELIDGIEIDGVKFIVKPGTAHRAIVVMKGNGLSSAVSDVDPHIADCKAQKCIPTNNSVEAKFTATLLNKFLKKSHEILSNHPLNAQLIANGNLPANYILLRGAGKYIKIPSFFEKYKLNACCIAGGGLYKGIASFLAMDIIEVEGATALPDSNIKNKFSMAMEKLKDYDFVFVHVKATDSLGEDGNFEGKKIFIEKADLAFSVFDNIDEETLLVVTADHSTPCELKSHSADSVPIMFYGKGVRIDNVDSFNERSCAAGGLGIVLGNEIMPQIQNIMGKLHLFGA
jgi:2,3-bisphosphoglycerate-independent phosphoglycerate mutase